LHDQEVDAKGEPIEAPWAKIGTFYIRKNAFERGSKWPQELRMTVEVVEAPVPSPP
jgi:hypothetical protein